jgi:hypothetical protein
MMEKIYIPKYFELYELLPPELYTYDMMASEVARERAFANYFDRKLLETIDIIRGEIIKAPLICNTWFQDGNRVASGYRTSKCPVGVAKSQHKEGKAVDLVCNKYTAEQMRQMIKDNEDKLPYPIRIEEGVSWLHIDTKDFSNTTKKHEKIYFFKG